MQVVAVADPDYAERLAEAITDEFRALVLAVVAEVGAATDRDRAARLAAEAERLVQSITSPHAKTLALALIADIWIHGVDRMIAPSSSIVTVSASNPPAEFPAVHQ